MPRSGKTFVSFAPALALAATLALPARAADLPAPYVSRALDAVLLPIDAAVQEAFGIDPAQRGVLVLSVDPNGTAAKAGVAPGDIIEQIHGKAVREPITLDEIVYYELQQGSSDFGIEAWHDGGTVTYDTVITEETWGETVDVTTVETWESYSSESFSYEEYASAHVTEMEESYASEETAIETEASSEEFAAAEGGDGEGMDPNLDSDSDGTPDVSDTDDDNDGVADAEDGDSNGDGTADAEE